MKNIKTIAYLITILWFGNEIIAQNIAVNATGNTPHTSAGLDVDFTNKGFLIPRVTAAQRAAIATPATSLLVYQTDAGTQGAGFYFFNGTVWTPWSTNSGGWGLNGNTGTSAATNFIGTTDAVDWIIKTSNTERARVLAAGNVGINMTPTMMLDVTWNTATNGNAVIRGNATGAAAQVYGVYGLSNSATGYGIYGTNSNGTGNGIVGVGNGLGPSLIANGCGGQFTSSNVGVFGFGNNTAGSYGAYGYSTNATGVGVFGQNTTNTGIGVYGFNSAAAGAAVGFAGFFRSLQTAGASLAANLGTNNYWPGAALSGVTISTLANGYGVFGSCESTTGVGVRGQSTGGNSTYGVYGNSSSGAGTFGTVNAAGGYGVWGYTATTGATPVVATFNTITAYSGTALSAVSANTLAGGIGAIGECNNATGIGLQGQSSGATGTGVYGLATGATGYGVYGATTATTGLGVLGSNNAANGASAGFGGIFSTNQTGGAALVANLRNTTYFSNTAFSAIVASTVAGGRAITAESSNATGISIQGQTTGASGIAVFASASGATGFGVSARNSNASGTGTISAGNNATANYLGTGSGGAFTGLSTGVYGSATSATATLNRAGGYFETNAGSGYAYVGMVDNTNVARKIEGIGTVNTIIKDVNNNNVLMSCPEATENFFQDFGKGKLLNGKAHIQIDPNFSKNIVVNEKHPLRVFVQLEGDCKGVFVSNQNADGFDVIELQGGNSTVTFTYFITANRADEVLADGTLSKYSNERFAPAAGKIVTQTVQNQMPPAQTEVATNAQPVPLVPMQKNVELKEAAVPQVVKELDKKNILINPQH
jgi:hypothetical protein